MERLGLSPIERLIWFTLAISLTVNQAYVAAMPLNPEKESTKAEARRMDRMCLVIVILQNAR